MSSYNLQYGKLFGFFKSLTANEHEHIDDNSSILKIAKGEVVFFEDELLKQLFCITEGACKFSLIDDNGKEHITKLLGKGDIMGRRSVITNKGSLVTATALNNTTLYVIDKKPIIQSMQKNNAFCQDVLKSFIKDMEDETEKILYFQNRNTLKVRLAGLLLYLHDKFGVEKEGWISVPLKRKDIANILGTTSEYVISLLTSFKEKKQLILKREKIGIVSNKHFRSIIRPC
jgi:CRP-like cAMP-binding protein